ncbi:MAG TPA: DUF4383 domain-containing protein [Kribbella sp.]|nr:DUF4383 domain-containing protein [Kribbella sp.]
MDNGTPRPAATQELALWIAGALFTLSCFGLLFLLRGEWQELDLQRPEQLLFGLFHVSLAHSIVHLLLAIGVLLSAGSLRGCRTLLSICGVVMIAIAGYGQLDSSPALPQLVPTGTADGWLHIVLGSAMLAATAVGRIHRRTSNPIQPDWPPDGLHRR